MHNGQLSLTQRHGTFIYQKFVLKVVGLYIIYNHARIMLFCWGINWVVIRKFRPNKKIHVFRVTPSCLNLLVKPRFVFRFAGEKKEFYAF